MCFGLGNYIFELIVGRNWGVEVWIILWIEINVRDDWVEEDIGKI